MANRRDIREILGAQPIKITKLAEQYVMGFPTISGAVETQRNLITRLEWLGWGIGGVLVLKQLIRGLRK